MNHYDFRIGLTEQIEDLLNYANSREYVYVLEVGSRYDSETRLIGVFMSEETINEYIRKDYGEYERDFNKTLEEDILEEYKEQFLKKKLTFEDFKKDYYITKCNIQ